MSCRLVPDQLLNVLPSGKPIYNGGIVHLKLFLPDCQWTFYVIGYDPDTSRLWGFVVDEKELTAAEMSIQELSERTGPLGYHVERDVFWAARDFDEVRATV